MQKKKEIYAVVGFEKKYLSLLVTVYIDSQFYILFNERFYYLEKKYWEEEKNLSQKGKILAKLIKKAEKHLHLKITSVSYNLPINDLKILPHSYFYQFNKPTILTPEKLAVINKKFLNQDNNFQKDYQNFLFKINQYILLDQKEILTKPPLNRIISSIKISGYLYQVYWKKIYHYQKIFKKAGLIQNNPILLPYAMHISLFFREKNANLIIVNWNEDEIQIFYFQNKIFTKYLTIAKSLKEFIEEISNEFNYEPEECKNYLFNLFNFHENMLINKLDFFVKNHNPKLEKINKGFYSRVRNFLKKALNEINFVLETKWYVPLSKSNVYLVGKITEISGLEKFVQNLMKNEQWKVSASDFIGTKDQNDIFLIGNAYYSHLQKKLLQQKQ